MSGYERQINEQKRKDDLLDQVATLLGQNGGCLSLRDLSIALPLNQEDRKLIGSWDELLKMEYSQGYLTAKIGIRVRLIRFKSNETCAPLILAVIEESREGVIETNE